MLKHLTRSATEAERHLPALLLLYCSRMCPVQNLLTFEPLTESADCRNLLLYPFDVNLMNVSLLVRLGINVCNWGEQGKER